MAAVGEVDWTLVWVVSVSVVVFLVVSVVVDVQEQRTSELQRAQARISPAAEAEWFVMGVNVK